jgi:hypothetical protein
MERFHKKIRISMATVACMRRRSDRPPSHVFVSIYQIWGDKKFLSFISKKQDWKSSPSILVTRNLNWSQRSGMETDCVKGKC